MELRPRFTTLQSQVNKIIWYHFYVENVHVSIAVNYVVSINIYLFTIKKLLTFLFFTTSHCLLPVFFLLNCNCIALFAKKGTKVACDHSTIFKYLELEFTSKTRRKSAIVMAPSPFLSSFLNAFSTIDFRFSAIGGWKILYFLGQTFM